MAINFSEIWSAFDWIIISVYFVIIIAVGLAMRKRASKNMKSFLWLPEDLQYLFW